MCIYICTCIYFDNFTWHNRITSRCWCTPWPCLCTRVSLSSLACSYWCYSMHILALFSSAPLSLDSIWEGECLNPSQLWQISLKLKFLMIVRVDWTPATRVCKFTREDKLFLSGWIISVHLYFNPFTPTDRFSLIQNNEWKSPLYIQSVERVNMDASQI